MNWTLVFEQIANGLVSGSTYALIGSGIALIYGTMRVLNLAHGELYMLGGFFVYFLIVQLGLSPLVAIPLAVLAVFAVGAAIERLTIHYLLSREGWTFACIAATLGLSIMLQNAALLVFGEQFKSVPYYLDGVVDIAGVRLPAQRLIIIVVAVLAIVAMNLLLTRTRFGWALRATAQDSEAAAVVGVPVARIHMLTFGLAAALGALAAAMLAPIYSVNPWMGMPVLFKGFVVVILGGLGSFPGAIVGGFALGLIEVAGVQLTSVEWRDAVAFAVLILAVWVRPWGLFGRPS